jgi:alkylated DNA repair dioxygenase AlkB
LRTVHHIHINCSHVSIHTTLGENRYAWRHCVPPRESKCAWHETARVAVSCRVDRLVVACSGTQVPRMHAT